MLTRFFVAVSPPRGNKKTPYQGITSHPINTVTQTYYYGLVPFKRGEVTFSVRSGTHHRGRIIIRPAYITLQALVMLAISASC